jgi:putative IMPACT (imprinted ancient) family translation regulator
MNVLIVVTRWFGGIHLGSKRFAHIINVAQITLNEFHDPK